MFIVTAGFTVVPITWMDAIFGIATPFMSGNVSTQGDISFITAIVAMGSKSIESVIESTTGAIIAAMSGGVSTAN